MCMLCGDVSQIQNEIKTGSVLIQFLVAIPILGFITFQIKSIFIDIKNFFNKRNKSREDVY